MGTNCAPHVADLFLYCYERDFMDSLNHDNQADVIEAFNSTSRYLGELLTLVNQIFLAHQIEKSYVLPHVRNSYLTLVISPRRTLRSSVLL